MLSILLCTTLHLMLMPQTVPFRAKHTFSAVFRDRSSMKRISAFAKGKSFSKKGSFPHESLKYSTIGSGKIRMLERSYPTWPFPKFFTAGLNVCIVFWPWKCTSGFPFIPRWGKESLHWKNCSVCVQKIQNIWFCAHIVPSTLFEHSTANKALQSLEIINFGKRF